MNINWRQFLAQHDVVYEQQSRIWQDGFPLGNGSLGVMAYEPHHLEYTINKNDVWDYRHPKFRRHSLEHVRRLAERIRRKGESNQAFVDEMNKEDGVGAGNYPCPKTCGLLRIRFGHNSVFAPGHRITKRLSLYDGVLRTSLDKHLSHPRVSSFVCAEDDVFVVSVQQVSAMVAFHNVVDISRAPDANMPPAVKKAKGDTLWLEQHFPDGFRYVLMARIVPTGHMVMDDLFRETVQKQWWSVIKPSEHIEGQVEGEYAVAPVAGSFDVYTTVVTSREASDPVAAARQRLASAVGKGVKRLQAEHTRWWANFWKASYVGFADPFLEQLWYISLYNLASSVRGTPVSGLCGLWYGPMDTPSQIVPWLGFYTNNYNMQLPVMPTLRANHPELAAGTHRTLLAQLPAARRNARRLYGLPGACYPLSADPTGDEITCGPNRFCQTSGPYWGMLLWRHYEYTKDESFLRETAYPILREVAIFFRRYLRWDEKDQRYCLELSQSGEQAYIHLQNPIDTLAYLKATFKAAIAAAAKLGRDKQEVVHWRHALDHFPAYPMTDGEFVALCGLPANHLDHVRVSAPFFPCGEIDPIQMPEWRSACLRDLEKMTFWNRRFSSNRGCHAGYTGFVFHIGMPACWLGKKTEAWYYLEQLLRANLKPNGLISHNGSILADSHLSERNIDQIPQAHVYHDLDTEPLTARETQTGRLLEESTENLDAHDTMFPAQEGPATYLYLVGEMLLQSHAGLLRFFPGLPDKKDAQFADLRAEGPTLVSAARVGGKVLFIRLKALADVEWKIKNPWRTGAIWIRKRRQRPCRVPVKGLWTLTLRQGDEVVLAPNKQQTGRAMAWNVSHAWPAAPRCLRLHGGAVSWLGKPEPERYYGVLQKARAAD